VSRPLSIWDQPKLMHPQTSLSPIGNGSLELAHLVFDKIHSVFVFLRGAAHSKGLGTGQKMRFSIEG
jgi:hypothetical protein